MHRKLSFCLAAALILALLAGCGNPSAAQTGSPAPESQAAETDPVLTTPQPTPEPTPEPTPLPWPVYEFGVPVEESEPAEDDSIFKNAVFLGDSRTEGLELFGGLEYGTFYWARGMTVFRVDDGEYKIVSIDGETYTVMDALRQQSFDAVYIMIGVNELGYPVKSYESGLSQLVDKVLEAQPEAVVYLQIMPPLNDALCRANGLGYYINNDNLQSFNEVIQRIAAEKKVALLNTAEVYTGEDGHLPKELASDGCHFAVGAYALWANYMRNHIIDRERYFYSREQA